MYTKNAYGTRYESNKHVRDAVAEIYTEDSYADFSIHKARRYLKEFRMYFSQCEKEANELSNVLDELHFVVTVGEVIRSYIQNTKKQHLDKNKTCYTFFML